MANRKEVTISDFYCTNCGKRGIPIARKISKQKEAGHLKNIFCLYCKKKCNHVEIRPFGSYTKEDFDEEFQLGRFVKGKRVPISNLLQCNRTSCDYNRNKRCWNANHSYHCNYRIIKENPNEETKNLLNRGW